MRLLVLWIATMGLALAQTVKTLDVKPDGKWMDTGIALAAGDQYTLEASGEIVYSGQNPQRSGPQGLSRGFRDLMRVMPVNEAGRGALIGRIGDRETSQPFFVGLRKEGTVGLGGNLFLNVNQTGNDSAEGSYSVKVTVRKGAAAPVGLNRNVVELSQSQLDSLPVRVVDAQGNEGDRVNFIVVGPEASVVAGLKTAGWVQVDKNAKESVLNALLLTMSKQSYLTLPMSTLMMFGRGQDCGFAHAVPFVVVAQRHHFRIWKAPFQVGGVDVWVGAGTHDIGFEKDQRNNGVTHKIDPETDKERDYIGQTLEESGMVVKKTYMEHRNKVTEAKTATGGSFRSDGRTLILYLEQQKKNESAQRFANLFCSVLAGNPDGGSWGDCTQYVETAPTAQVNLKPMSRDYRVVVVPGIFSSCASDAPAFEKARTYLKEKQGVEAALLGVPNNSSEDNGKAIAKYLRDNWVNDQRKYILVGYSKGTPDIQTALALEPDIRDKVAAFIAVAGASGGSPVADALPQKLNGLLAKLNGKGGCQGDLSDGFQSLSVERRRQFLATYPTPFVKTYSLPAVADKDKVSKVMVQSWTVMNSFSARNDAQLAEVDAIVPGSTVLGSARSDHFALALPLEDMQGGALKALLDKNTYPRAALLESLVRYVLEDLGAAPAAEAYQPPKKTSIFQ